MSRPLDSRLNATALLSILVGVFGTICFFWGIAGVGAIVLGIVANGEIKRSEGKQHGQGLAVAGIVLGVVHLVALVLGVAAMFTFAIHPPAFLTPHAHRTPRGTTFTPPPKPSPVPSAPAVAGARPGAATREQSTKTSLFGKLSLVDPGQDVSALKPLIDAQHRVAVAEHQKLLLWITATDCAPCNGVSVALGSRRMQEALAGVRLLRLDAADFHVELTQLGIPIDVTPGFALIGTNGTPQDYVNGGEWDADIPENIAPVLGSFVRGAYRNRRNPWRGPHRSDETAL